jgi:multiple sugar transport system permease protein
MTSVPRAAVGSVARTHRVAQRPRSHDAVIGWSFALPFVVIFLLFMAGPIVASFLFSLTGFGLADITNPIGASFVGLQNYIELFRDPRFLQAALNTAYFVVAGVPLTLIAGLLAAIALNQGVVRFKALFRVGYYLPVVTAIVAIAVIWRFLLHPDQGLLNLVLAQAGIQGPNWLANPVLAMPSIIAMAVWRNFGFSMVIFLAGLQTISVSLYEAARIDGAGRWQEFRYVTLPGLRPTLLFTVVTTSIGYLNLFEEPFVMTGGGPLDKTLSVTMYLYQQGFTFFRQGYAAAVAYVLFAAVVVLALVQFRLLRSED